MSVRVLAGWTDRDWDDQVRRHREGTFFHTRVWAKICCQSFPELEDRSSWIEVTTSAGSSRHLLPLFAWRRAAGLVTTTHCSFPHIYGGPLPLRGAGGASVLRAALDYLATLSGSVLVTTNPFAERVFDQVHRTDGLRGKDEPTTPNGVLEEASSWEGTQHHTHLRTLPGSDREFWEGELTSRRRNDVRRLEKKGISVEETGCPGDISLLYRLYLASFERWGGPPAFVHPEALYQNLVALGGNAVRLSVARYEGQVIGGVFAIRFGPAVHYFAGYFDSEARALRPNVLLQVDSIRQAVRDRFPLYDFLPSGGNRSVEEFKEGFGGVRIEVPAYLRRSLGRRLLARVRRR